MMAHMLSNKKRNPTVTKLFINRGKKLNIHLVFITQSYFFVPKNMLNPTHNFIMKSLTKRELQQIGLNHLTGVEFKNFMIFYKN